MPNLPPPDVAPSTCVLYHGDCLEVMPRLEPKSVQMVFADLPYGVTKKSWDTLIDLNAFWEQVHCLTKSNAAYLLTATGLFMADLIVSQRALYRYDIVWHKGRTTGFLNANRMPLRSHEQVTVFYKKQPKYNPQMTDGAPWKKQTARGSNHKYGGVVKDNMPQDSCGLRHPTSVLKLLSSNKDSIHPTQKPIALLDWLIKTYTNEGDTVLDPVFGSATTAVACARLGRNFVGIEKDADYFRIGTERVNAERLALGLEPAVVMQ